MLSAILSAALACQAPLPYPDIEIGFGPMRLFPVAAGARPPRIAAQQVIDQVIAEYGAIQVVRLGRRTRGDGATVWVLVFRPVAGGQCADCWIGRVVDDQIGGDFAHFDAASLRSFGIPVPDW